MSLDFNAVHAFDEAFSGKAAHVVVDGGVDQPLDVGLWTCEPDAIDVALFIDPCEGATMDIGCGPGRIVGELTNRRVPAMGIDVSPEAIRQTRARGAWALRRDVFDSLPGEGRWDCALLVDGNLGIGGDPALLLARIRQVIAADGCIIAEVAEHGAGYVQERQRLRVEGRISEHFDWATVGLDAIDDIATRAGLNVARTHTVGDRHAVTLRPA